MSFHNRRSYALRVGVGASWGRAVPFDREGERGGREFIGTGSISEDGNGLGSAAGSASLDPDAAFAVFPVPGDDERYVDIMTLGSFLAASFSYAFLPINTLELCIKIVMRLLCLLINVLYLCICIVKRFQNNSQRGLYRD